MSSQHAYCADHQQSNLSAERDSHAVKALYHVTSDVDPGTLPRLLQALAKLGVAPVRVHASREAGDGSTQSIDMRVVDTTPDQARIIENMLRRVVGVQQLILVMEAA